MPKRESEKEEAPAMSHANVRSEAGQNTVEYLLMLAVIVGVVIVLSTAFRSALPKIFEGVMVLVSDSMSASGDAARNYANRRSKSSGGGGGDKSESNGGFVFAGFFKGARGEEIGMFSEDQGKPALTSLANAASWVLPKVSKAK